MFDLDGTLVDSIGDIHHALNLALADQDLEPVNLEDVRVWVGNGTPILVHRAITGTWNGKAETEFHSKTFEAFLAHYERRIFVDTFIYPGVIETLEKFKAGKKKMAIVTNKQEKQTLTLLAASGMTDYFDCVIGGDSLPKRKPDPLPLTTACEVLGLSKDECVMVGDSASDINSAKSAGMPVVCMGYGYHQNTPPEELGADIVINQFDQLLKLID